jgi:hypothetical protein
MDTLTAYRQLGIAFAREGATRDELSEALLELRASAAQVIEAHKAFTTARRQRALTLAEEAALAKRPSDVWLPDDPQRAAEEIDRLARTEQGGTNG